MAGNDYSRPPKAAGDSAEPEEKESRASGARFQPRAGAHGLDGGHQGAAAAESGVAQLDDPAVGLRVRGGGAQPASELVLAALSRARRRR